MRSAGPGLKNSIFLIDKNPPNLRIMKISPMLIGPGKGNVLSFLSFLYQKEFLTGSRHFLVFLKN